MVIDKFGRQLQKGPEEQQRASSRGPAGVGFKLSAYGDFDLENKRLLNVADPQDDSDAVNKKSTLVVLPDAQVINVRKRRLVNALDPVADSDVSTKNYVRIAVRQTAQETLAKCLSFNKDNNNNNNNRFYDAENKQIKHVDVPIDSADATNKLYVDGYVVMKVQECLKLDSSKAPKSKQFSARSKRITNVAGPSEDNDAANKKYVESRINELREAVAKHVETLQISLLLDGVIELIKFFRLLFRRSNNIHKHLELTSSPLPAEEEDADLNTLISLFDRLKQLQQEQQQQQSSNNE